MTMIYSIVQYNDTLYVKKENYFEKHYKGKDALMDLLNNI